MGVWPAVSGCVRLDGSELGHWDEAQLGRSIGYLPQDVELFSGTIAENIARFSEVHDSEVVAAARLAGVHDLIQHLPQGYNTQIGEGGTALSGGQRQRIGLARAVFGRPALIVLDEPNASLDPPGELALTEALRQLRAVERTVVIVTHRTSVLSQCDLILALADGAPQVFGPREEVLKRIMGVAPPSADHPGAPPTSHPAGHPPPQPAPQVVRTRPPLASVPGGAAATAEVPPGPPATPRPPAMEDGHAVS